MTTDDPSRRNVLLGGAAVAGATLLAARSAAAQPHDHAHHQPAPRPPAPPPAPRPRAAPRPPGSTVVTPNGRTLPWKTVGGVKVMHLTAQPIHHVFAPGLEAECWGYNGGTPGPTIEVVEGDRVRFYVTNRLPEPTSVHWHGVILPNGMDGVAGLTQKRIEVGETCRYQLTFDRPGTFMYHSHFDEMTQIALGMVGMIVVHPRRARRADRDYALMLHEWKLTPGARRPDPMAMNDFNLLTFNGVAFPATEPLVAQRGERVRIRLGNLGPMDHHPIHIHGHAFRVVETDGGPVPRGAQTPETSILVPVGSVRVIELVADNPGDWPFHCHMTHHVMNQMGHAGPSTLGADLRGVDMAIGRSVPGAMVMGTAGMGDMADMKMPVPTNSIPMQGTPGPFGSIDMGGMFTIIKVRERLTGTGDPGWYRHPEGTVARPATAAELQADGIVVE
jgi:FtsP/CotA-like multicopper oxidase with cupredoxin domain